MDLEPNVWGPHYWFFLHSITFTYPKNPTSATKKKYYDFIHNLPLFIPHKNISKKFVTYLDAYPLTPYLDSSTNFQKWMLFIHNKINKSIGKEELTYYDLVNNFNDLYKPKRAVKYDFLKWKQKILYVLILFLLMGILYYLYNK
tara:strand:+ start:109 stop:540 length:432 start_codon:yes stop_codon:yes gene_type:complete